MQLSFWIILIVVMLYGLVHSLLASLKAKAQARRWFGPSADRWFRLAYNVFATLTLLPVLALPVALVDRKLYAVPSPWVYLTLALQGLAALSIVIGIAQTGLWSFLGLSQLVKQPQERPPRFVQGGLYRWVRHPLYTAGLIFIWLAPVMTCNLLALNLGLSLYLVVGSMVEERKLQAEFGEVYTAYCKRTPMLLPGMKWKREQNRRRGEAGE